MITFKEYDAALSRRYDKDTKNKITTAKVAVAGLGGLGSNIAIYLARAGVGHLHLVDFDRVDITNLNRQQYDISDIGTFKTTALSEKIKRFNPFIKITTDNAMVTEENVKDIFSSYPIICEAFDKAENKAMLVNCILSEFRDTKIISASGMAGLYSPNIIKTRKINDRFYLCGDTKNEIDTNIPLFAPRVALCAAHQATTVLQIITGKEEI